MTMLPPATDSALNVRRVFKASRPKVFHAWTTPEYIVRWMGDTNVVIPEATVDLRVGGEYRIGFRQNDADLFYVAGIYQEVRIPEKLVYTWGIEGPLTDPNKTLVTVEFNEVGSTTEIVLTHERFPDVASRDDHLSGWQVCFDRLGQLVS